MGEFLAMVEENNDALNLVSSSPMESIRNLTLSVRLEQ
jgi:hypothetical protein